MVVGMDINLNENNRWLVIVGAVIIQLCLGAIYAWSVFTPTLVLPMEDGDFENDMTIVNGTELVLDGDWYDSPATGEDLEFTVDFEGTGVANGSLVNVVVEKRTEDNGNTSEEKFYHNFTYAGTAHTITNLSVPVTGNWHVVVTTPVGDADVLVQEGLTGIFGFTKSETQLVFSIGLVSFAIFTVIAGRLQPVWGPRNTALIGGVLLGIGYMIAGAVGQTLLPQVVFIGIMGGVGIGMAYVVPIAVGIKWYPDKKGLVSGLGVAGFGFGATLWVQLAAAPKSFLPAANLIGSMGVLGVFAVYGLIFLVFVCLGSLLMMNPPEGYKPKGWEPPVATDKACASGANEFDSGEMLKTPQFWMVWSIFCIGALAGLMVIGNIALFGKEQLVKGDFTTEEAAAIAATAMALFAIFNGAGRIAWGLFSDKIGRQNAIMAMSGSQGILMLLFFSVGQNQVLFTLFAMLIGFNFGGNFALFPSITADFFGNKSVGKNYGFTFTSYGVGGLVGPMLGGAVATYSQAFYPAGILCLIGAGIAFMLKPPAAVKADEACEEKTVTEHKDESEAVSPGTDEEKAEEKEEAPAEEETKEESTEEKEDEPAEEESTDEEPAEEKTEESEEAPAEEETKKDE